jgi:hypothetical protein
MPKWYLAPLFIVAVAGSASAQTNSSTGTTEAGGGTAPGVTGDPGRNNQVSDESNQRNAPSRPRRMEGDTPTNAMPNTSQSVAPGSSPQGSNEPQKAKPNPR